MPLSTSDFAGDGIRRKTRGTEYASMEERTSQILTYFGLEVEFFLQCAGPLTRSVSLFYVLKGPSVRAKTILPANCVRSPALLHLLCS